MCRFSNFTLMAMNRFFYINKISFNIIIIILLFFLNIFTKNIEVLIPM